MKLHRLITVTVKTRTVDFPDLSHALRFIRLARALHIKGEAHVGSALVAV